MYTLNTLTQSFYLSSTFFYIKIHKMVLMFLKSFLSFYSLRLLFGMDNFCSFSFKGTDLSPITFIML